MVLGTEMLQKLVNGIQTARPIGSARWAGALGLAVAVGIPYFFAAQMGLALLTASEGVAVFWPAAGIAAGTLIALGPWARAPGDPRRTARTAHGAAASRSSLRLHARQIEAFRRRIVHLAVGDDDLAQA